MCLLFRVCMLFVLLCVCNNSGNNLWKGVSNFGFGQQSVPPVWLCDPKASIAPDIRVCLILFLLVLFF